MVQDQPSAARFPDGEEYAGESLAAMSARAVAAIRETDAGIEADVGASALWVAVTHGDVVKAVVADALGQHLDLFQRIVVDPGSATVIRYTAARPMVLTVNSVGGALPIGAEAHGRPGDAAVGGEPARQRPGQRVSVVGMPVFEFDAPRAIRRGHRRPPGERVFFLQARQGRSVAAVSLEKQQVAILADRVNDILDEVAGSAASEEAAAAYGDDLPLDAPVEDEFRVVTISLAWDRKARAVIIECPDDDPETTAGPEGRRARRATRARALGRRAEPARGASAGSRSSSPRRRPGPSRGAPRRSSPPAGRRARSAVGRWRPRGTSAPRQRVPALGRRARHPARGAARSRPDAPGRAGHHRVERRLPRRSRRAADPVCRLQAGPR